MDGTVPLDPDPSRIGIGRSPAGSGPIDRRRSVGDRKKGKPNPSGSKKNADWIRSEI